MSTDYDARFNCECTTFPLPSNFCYLAHFTACRTVPTEVLYDGYESP